MNIPTIAHSEWQESTGLLVTHISGDATLADVERWEESLHSELARIPSNGSFKIFVNLHGFTAADIEAHKRFRTIVPSTLADYGWKTGYVNLFEEEAEKMTFRTINGIRCTAAAHCHQDETKIAAYESKFSSENEHFFTNPDEAMRWISGKN